MEPCVEPHVVKPPVEPRVEPHVEHPVEPVPVPTQPIEVAPPPRAEAGAPSLRAPASAEGGKWENQQVKFILHDHINPLRWKCGIP